MKTKRYRDYVSQGRYGYGAVDLYEIENGDRRCMSTVVAGITQKLARSYAADLNSAYWAGREDAVCNCDRTGHYNVEDAPKCPAKRVRDLRNGMENA